MPNNKSYFYVRVGKNPRYDLYTGKENEDGYRFFLVAEHEQLENETYEDFNKRMEQERQSIENKIHNKSGKIDAN